MTWTASKVCLLFSFEHCHVGKSKVSRTAPRRKTLKFKPINLDFSRVLDVSLGPEKSPRNSVSIVAIQNRESDCEQSGMRLVVN
jgi:hypothetical protein